MVRVTCLFPMKKILLLLFSFCSLGKLDLRSSNGDPSTRTNHGANIQVNKKIHLRTIHQNKRKALKEHTKGIGLVATVTRAQETQKTELECGNYGINSELRI